MSNVIDLKTGKALFNTKTRACIQEGLRPYFKGDASDTDRAQAVSTVEQILCLALVAGARRAGESLANKIIGFFTKQAAEPVPAPTTEDAPVV